MKKTTANNLFNYCLEKLPRLEEGERQSIVYILLEDIYGISKKEIGLNNSIKIDFKLLDYRLTRLNSFEPVQQLVGFSYFRGNKFEVNSNVLIPRPETEELIDLVKKHSPPAPKIIDIGTGSGCIAISLALEIKNSDVHALDISKDALKVAEQNAISLNSDIHFRQIDILKNPSLAQGKFDIIVSNPPYIRDSEKTKMAENVLNFEPHIALFVEDKQALIFYESIATFGKNHLNTDGFIAVEINSFLGQETIAVFKKASYKEVTLIKDFHENDRFIIAKK